MTGEQKDSEFKHFSDGDPAISFKHFVETLELWRDSPWNGDEGMAAFSDAVLDMLPPNMEDVYEHGVEELYEAPAEDRQQALHNEFLLMVGRYLEDHDDPAAIDSLTNTSISYKIRKLYHAVRFVSFIMKDDYLMERTFERIGRPTPRMEYDYPDDFDKPEAFTKLIEVIMDNPALADDWLRLALERFRIRTTLIPRYLVPRLELAEEFGDRPIRLASVGIGSGHGEKALIANVPFDDVEIMEPVVDSKEPSKDEAATAVVNRKKQEPLNIQELLGFDLLIRDKAQDTWIESSLLWREHKDQPFMDKYHAVADVEDARLALHRLDFTDEAEVDKFILNYQREHGGTPDQETIDDFRNSYEHEHGSEIPDEAFQEFLEVYAARFGQKPDLDVCMAITMMYQLKTEEERESVRRNMAKLVHQDGFILEQDSLDGAFEQPYSYVTIKYYPHHPEIPRRVIAYSRDDRCRQIVVDERLSSSR